MWSTAGSNELKAHIDVLGNPAFIMDVGEDGRFRLLCNNKRHEESTGLPCHDVQGRYLDEILPPAVAQGIASQYRRCVERNERIEYEEELQLPAGVRWWKTI